MADPRYRAYIQLRKNTDYLYHRQAVRYGMPDSVLRLAATICECETPPTPTELYTDCSMSKPTGHSALVWLEKRGLVRLAADGADRRSKRVELTPAGQEFADRQVRPTLEAEVGAFAALTRQEQETLLALTEKLYLALKAETDRRPAPGKG